MTNQEIEKVCRTMAARHSDVDWGFRIEQENGIVKIFWGYLDGECWTVHPCFVESDLARPEDGTDIVPLNFFPVYNEDGYMMNGELESDGSLKDAVESAAYYMATRY